MGVVLYYCAFEQKWNSDYIVVVFAYLVEIISLSYNLICLCGHTCTFLVYMLNVYVWFSLKTNLWYGVTRTCMEMYPF